MDLKERRVKCGAKEGERVWLMYWKEITQGDLKIGNIIKIVLDLILKCPPSIIVGLWTNLAECVQLLSIIESH